MPTLLLFISTTSMSLILGGHLSSNKTESGSSNPTQANIWRDAMIAPPPTLQTWPSSTRPIPTIHGPNGP